MSEHSNTILTVAGLAGAVYLGHRWLTGNENEAKGAGSESEPVAPDREDAAPVQSPSQVERGLARDFDPVFATQGQRLPLAYLRALASAESDMNPNRAETPSWGLMQIDEITRHAYNKRHGTNFRRADLLNPSINVSIAADALRLILASYRKFHLDIANLQEDWSNLRFVELLTFGWATSFGQRAGVGRVVDHLRRLKIFDVTLDKVFAHAAAAGASPQLAREENVSFAKRVARLYDRERVNSQAR